MTFAFGPASDPLPRWLGPFSPARGTRADFRVVGGRLGVWVEDDFEISFWTVGSSPGISALESFVTRRWGGGRVLLLPDGKVIKPLQEDDEVGIRVLCGRFAGPLILEKPDETTFDFSGPGQAGGAWLGPRTTGLECTLSANGSLSCTWYHPTPSGRETHSYTVVPANPSLAIGFRKARPRETTGRVRVTASGLVLTNYQYFDGAWATRYVGRIDPSRWPSRPDWIGGGLR